MDRPFSGGRSVAIYRNGCVSCSQPLAAEIGLQILKQGGNAADAAVATAAALNVTEPCSTGIGGDCFCIFYDASTKKVQGINGSGRCSSGLTLDLLNSKGYTQTHPPPVRHALNITVPGAAAGWEDTINKFGSGKFSLHNILQPAIDLAREGFPVAPITAHHWEKGSGHLRDPGNPHGGDMLLDGCAPRVGEIMKMPHLAETFEILGEEGRKGFYEGRIGDAIVECVRAHGGVMTGEDLRDHHSTFDMPIKTGYREVVDVWEVPPNGQGITALMALNILEGFNFSDIEHNSTAYLHLLIEAMQLSFADAWGYCADPLKVKVPVEGMLSKEYAKIRRDLIRRDCTLPAYLKGEPLSSSDTVYFSVVDRHGNACSFINSNYMGFGTGLVPKGCGFTLQNRGANFSLDPTSPNAVTPGKRSYHTIIPGLATYSDSGDLMASFGVMGGFMQPQGHVQVILNMLEFGMNPQEALDAPRFCIIPPPKDIPGVEQAKGGVALEVGISEDVILKLKALGHDVIGPVTGHNRSVFGRGQIITSRPIRGENVWWAGSDGRADGLAIGY